MNTGDKAINVYSKENTKKEVRLYLAIEIDKIKKNIKIRKKRIKLKKN